MKNKPDFPYEEHRYVRKVVPGKEDFLFPESVRASQDYIYPAIIHHAPAPVIEDEAARVRKKNITNLKIYSILLILLFFAGLTGLFIALFDINLTYKRNVDTLGILAGEVTRLEKKIAGDEEKISNYSFMEYKVNAFTKRFSSFAQILDSVYHKSIQYGFQPELVLSIVQVESNYNPNAVSYVGACGLMQVNLPVWRKELAIDEKRIFDVDYNVDLGLRILKHYYDETGGNINRALHLYNNGYLHNNTGYLVKVNSAFRTLKPAGFNLAIPSN
ncbi:MAG: lytic transglycosylase domain-containing protein [bacterium]|nr:lytic transglycosylase domain-containing protein [bacterium]